MNANGRNLRQLTSLGARSLFPDWSPSGDEIAFGLQLTDGTSSIWAADAKTGSSHRIVPASTAPGVWADRFPAYSPDGSTVLFVRQLLERNAAGNLVPVQGQLWLHNLCSGVSTQLTFDATFKDQVPDWSPDGRRIAYGASDAVWVMDSDGANRTNLTGYDGAIEFGAAWSPRGHFIAFTGGGADVPAGERYVQVIRADGNERHSVAPTPGLLQAVAGWQPLGPAATERGSAPCVPVVPQGARHPSSSPDAANLGHPGHPPADLLAERLSRGSHVSGSRAESPSLSRPRRRVCDPGSNSGRT